MSWKLKRTKQCSKCPWRKETNPSEISNGYSLEKHKALKTTIVSGVASITSNRVMACHETHNAYCIGWLVNQLEDGDNIGMRFRMLDCTNVDKIELVGEQHEKFEDTIPK